LEAQAKKLTKTMYAIEIQNLFKTYATGKKAVNGVNLNINQGDFFALMGANGAGKTTIIGILTALVNKTSGTVKIMDVDIDKDFPKAKSFIGVVPQEFNFSIFEKVIDIVVNQAGYYGIPRDKAIPKATEILTALGLKDKLNNIAKELSGGMKRRLMIARALIHDPKILVLDEPTAGVDVELRIGMWEYLTKLNAAGTTIILTTHYLEEVEQLCKNAAIIKSGEIVREATVKELLNSVNEETYHIDVDKVDGFELKSFKLKTIDENTFEVKIQKGEALNELVIELDKNKIKVLGIRPQGNRLEELFLGVVGK
jgi:ABC-2 type transport system ATP-binding protein